MAQRDAEGMQRNVVLRVLAAPFGYALGIAGRFGRHWFMFGVLFGGLCLAIRGSIFIDYGVAFLFREDRLWANGGWLELLHSQAFLTGLLSMLLAGTVWVFAVDLDPTRAQVKRRFHHQIAPLSARILPLGALPVLALYYPASLAIQDIGSGEKLRAFGGCCVGYGLTLSVLAIASVIEHHLYDRSRSENPVMDWTHRWLPHLARWIHWNNAERRLVILWAMYVLAWVGIIVVPPKLPVVAIFAMTAVLLAAYVLLNFFVERVRFWVFLGMVAVPVFVHGNTEYPYIFPDLKPQYALCDGLIAHPLPKVKPTPWQPEFCGTLSRDAALAAAARTGEFQRVPPAQPLRALKTLHLPPQPNGEVRRPRLVVVAISGGAYRAAFWGALVLDRLRQESEPGRPLEGLAQSIRLLTGASGGMVPAAYFAVQPAQGVEKAMEADIVGANASPGSPEPADGSFDSLTPIARQLVQDDLLNTLLPRRRDHDRGTALEDQWKTLDVTFESLRESEAQGNRPSLIFSPMIAETGQPLLISNLDLAGIPDRDSDQAVDLFKKMPEAPGLLKLKTAVRMSATFPFVSPSVSLPTIPPLHVLDAGYFDNYGMSIALGYLKQPDIVQWLADNTSGVMLIQIKAFAQSAEADTGIAGKCRQPPAVPDSWINRAFSAVTSPLAGLFNSRGSSMVFRNDLELDSLKQLLGKTRDKDGNPLRLDSIAFDNAARASFSWYLPKGDLDCMRQQLNAPRIASQFKKLEAAWNAWAPTITSADIAEPTPPEPQ